MFQRTATAQWEGNLKVGNGVVSTPSSGALKSAKYTFKTRFENDTGTNPEELIAAAHASCFSMAFANELAKAGMQVKFVKTKATITVEKGEVGFDITKSHLDVEADVSGAVEKTFMELAEKAKVNCPVSKVLKAEITMTAKLAGN